MDLDFDKIFFSSKLLKLNRSHPKIKRDGKWFLFFFIAHGLFTSIFLLVIYNIVYIDFKTKNFSQACKNGVLSVVYVVITYQYLVLHCKQDSLAEMIDIMNSDFKQSVNLKTNEKLLILEHVKLGQYVCKQWLLIAAGGAFLFVFKNIVLIIYYYCINEPQYVPIYDLIYPSAVIEERKHNDLFVYSAIYVSLLLYELYAAVMYAAFVPIGPIFILHACGQLEIVVTKIDDLFTECDNEVIRIKVKEIIEHLQKIYSFLELINECFKICYELTLKATTIILPITCYEVLEAAKSGEVSMEFITFIVGGTLISSSPCFYSDLLMEKGEKVRLALYMCGWEQHYDRRTRTTLQLMLLRALRPIAIRTVFRTVCLEALTDLFQQAYAIFNLMKVMWG